MAAEKEKRDHSEDLENENAPDDYPYSSWSIANHSVGLDLWGFLVPSSYNRSNVIILSVVQSIIGYKIMKFANGIVFPKPSAASRKIPGYMTEFSGMTGRYLTRPTRKQVWINRAIRLPLSGLGLFLLGGSALEALRLQASYDPFYENAYQIEKLVTEVNIEDGILERESEADEEEPNIFISKFIRYWFGPYGAPRITKDEYMERMTNYLDPRMSWSDNFANEKPGPFEKSRLERKENAEIAFQRYKKIHDANRKYMKQIFNEGFDKLYERRDKQISESQEQHRCLFAPFNIKGKNLQATINTLNDFDKCWKERVAPFLVLKEETSVGLRIITQTGNYIKASELEKIPEDKRNDIANEFISTGDKKKFEEKLKQFTETEN